MSDSLLNLPVKNIPATSEEYAKIQPYLSAPQSLGAELNLRFYVLIGVLFVLLSLPFWNSAFGKLNIYVILIVKLALFVFGIIAIQKFAMSSI